MNTIVRRHVTVQELPADWREGLPADAQVTVTIEARDTTPDRGHFSRFWHIERDTFATMDDIVAQQRRLRDEWNER